MGSVGFTTRFTRNSMGYGRTPQEAQVVTYESEPLQPLFGSPVPISPLREPESMSENTQPPSSRDRMGGDMAWIFGRPQTSQVQVPRIITCDGEQKRVTQRIYINRGFREAGMSR